MTQSTLPLGVIPPLGETPERMLAQAIRKDRHGEPDTAIQVEELPIPEVGPKEVLVYVMAAGVNYNGVWASLGQPMSVLDVHKHPFHIAGSDAAGVIWKVGSAVRNWSVGDEVIIHCNQTCGDCEACNGGDPMVCRDQRIWGYETPYGSFAQYCVVQAQQILPKPTHLSWEAASCYTLVLATAYRMLFGHRPHDLRPGQNVLVWGAAGGLGSMAVQLINAAGGRAIGVVSSDEKAEYVMKLGAAGTINRKEFDCWGRLPETTDKAAYGAYLKRVRVFGKAIWQFTGKGNDVDMVFEHPGEMTFPVSAYVVRRGGMVVFCAGTTGFNITFDAAYVWMRQKRIQGSHFATLEQAAEANRLVMAHKVDPCLSQVFPFEETARPHMLMRANQHPPGNQAILVNAPREGLRNLEETRAATG
jgi:crotonyl-CoA carboxylase/reductase